MAEGRAEGREDGITQGERLQLIVQIKQKIQKGLSDEVIIEHLKLCTEKDEELLVFCRANPAFSPKEIVEKNI